MVRSPTSTSSVGDGIAATTSAVFVTESTIRAREARVVAEDSNSKDAGQEEEQTLEDLRTYN